MSSYSTARFFELLTQVGPKKFVEMIETLAAALEGSSVTFGAIEASSLTILGQDGNSKVSLLNNTSIETDAGEYLLTFEAGRLLAVVDGVKYEVPLIGYTPPDFVNPVVLLGENTTHDGTGTTFTITAAMIIEDNLDVVEYRLDAGTYLTATLPQAVNIPSDTSNHTLDVKATDNFGNVGAGTIVFLYEAPDLTDPVVDLGADTTHDGTGGSFEITVAMVTEDNLDTVEYNWDGEANTTITLPFTVAPPSDTSNHTLNVIATDLSSNTGSDSKVFTYVAPDLTDPVVDLGADTTHDGAGTTFEITAAMVVEDNLDTVEYNWDGGANTTITLPETVTVPSDTSNHILNVIATDLSSNTGSDSKAFTYTADTTDPVVNLGTDTVHDGTGPTFEITAAMVSEDNLDTVEYNWDGGGNTTITLPETVTVPSNTSNHTLNVIATDLSSNTGSDSKVFTYVAPATYIVEENFETGTTGYENTWNESGSVNPIYTPALSGTQSLNIYAPGGTADTSFTAQQELWTAFIFRINALPSNNKKILALVNTSAVENAAILLKADGSLAAIYNTGSSGVYIPTDLVIDTTYYMWLHFIPSTTDSSLDGEVHLYVSTSNTRPISPTVSNTTGVNFYQDINKIFLAGGYSGDWVYDKIIVSDSPIGDL